MSHFRHFAAFAGGFVVLSACLAAGAAPMGAEPPQAQQPPAEPQPAAPAPTTAQPAGQVVLKDTSLDKPLVLDQNVDYKLRNVTVTGVFDCAALTLAGRIHSVDLDHCSFGRVWTGQEGKAAGLECAGAVVNSFSATNSTFFDAENQLATLREGTFGRVRFEHCHFTTSQAYLKELYANSPWRDWLPVTEFYHIDRLELLDNEYSNTTVIIHPSVRQVIIRGNMPGLQIENPQATQLIQLQPGQVAESVPLPPDAALASAIPTPAGKG